MESTDYETSKKLEEIGFKSETSLYHILTIENGRKGIFLGDNTDSYIERVKSYKIKTILKALPKQISISDEEGEGLFPLRIDRDKMEYRLGNEYYSKSSGFFADIKDGENPATTAAKLLICLVEEGIIELKVSND